MKLLNVDHAQITIPPGAEEQAKAFYCGVLGLPELAKPEVLQGRGGFWLELDGFQIHIGIDQYTDRTMTKAHLAYAVDNLPDWRERLVDEGIEIIDGIQIPNFRRFEFRDPFGNRVEFLERMR
ncbi:MAG TPA: VOC family protein [Pyrinomonadaceae bacterium]|nr:VOC family protein [Pyrinomonadaceae bacterium]